MKGSHALITGGSSGIGLETARRWTTSARSTRSGPVARGMVERGRGSIVAVSSGAGLLGVFGYTA